MDRGEKDEKLSCGSENCTSKSGRRVFKHGERRGRSGDRKARKRKEKKKENKKLKKRRRRTVCDTFKALC